MGDKAAEGSALQTAKDLFAGAAGGVAQVLIGITTLLISPQALLLC
jgi:hypothetical protein